MSRSRLLGVAASFTLLLTLFVVLPRLGAQEQKKEGKAEAYRSLGLFTEVYSLVNSNYVEQPERRQLFAGAFAGITDALDPFSEYIPPEKMDAWQAAASAREKKETFDSGVVLARRFGYPSVVTATPGSPAAAAGLKSDDVIERIDDKPVRGIGLWDVEARLAGKPGTKVSVLVVREGKPRRRTVEIVRGSWSPAPTAVSREKGQTVVTIPTFAPGTVESLRQILAAFDPTKPILVDVRGNASGSFEEAARAAALFVPAGPLAELAGRKSPSQSYRAEPGERIHMGRIVLLVDSGTGGAAELFAAAIRESGRPKAAIVADAEVARRDAADGDAPEAKPAPKPGKELGPNRLVGEPTVGMGFRAEVVRLASGGALKLAVAKLKTASGRPLSPRGLEPDERVFVGVPDDGAPKPPDLILERGLKLLAEMPAVVPLPKAA